MNPTLSKLKNAGDAAAEVDANRKVREYHALMREKTEELRNVRDKSRKENLLKTTAELIGKTARDYPRCENLPGVLPTLFNELHRDSLSPHRALCGTIEPRTDFWLQKVENAKPADFARYNPKILAECDLAQIRGLLAEFRMLKELPETIRRAIQEINETAERLSQRPIPAPAATVLAPSPSRKPGEGEQIDTFDPRL